MPELICKILHIGKTTYYKYLNNNYPIVKFLLTFSKKELEELLKTGNISKMNHIKKFEEAQKKKTLEYLSLFKQTLYTPAQFQHGFVGLQNFQNETKFMYIDFLVYLDDISLFEENRLENDFFNFISKVNPYKACFERNDYSNIFSYLVNNNFEEILFENIKNNFLPMVELTKNDRELHEEALYHAIYFVCKKNKLDIDKLHSIEKKQGNEFFTIETFKKLIS